MANPTTAQIQAILDAGGTTEIGVILYGPGGTAPNQSVIDAVYAANALVGPETTIIADRARLGVYSVKDYGAKGDGTTDDAAAIQTCINAAPTGARIIFPAGTYLIGTTLTLGRHAYEGGGHTFGFATLKMKDGANLDAIACTPTWLSAAVSPTCDNPLIVRNLQFDANYANQTGGLGHGLICMAFGSLIERNQFFKGRGAGVFVTDTTAAGHVVTNTMVEIRIERNRVDAAGQHGIYVKSGTSTQLITDGFCIDNIIAGAGQGTGAASGMAGIRIEPGAGWHIHGNHTYGTQYQAIIVQGAYNTRVTNNYVDGYGAAFDVANSNSDFPSGLNVTLQVNGPVVIADNTVIHYGAEAANPNYQHITVNGNQFASGTTMCALMGNLVRNTGSANGKSLGFSLNYNGDGTGAMLVQMANNLASGAHAEVGRDNQITLVSRAHGDIDCGRHFTATNIAGTSLSAAAGANAGTTPPAPVVTGTNDVRGTITFGTGTTPAAGAQVVGTFAKAYGATPNIVVTPNNSATAALTLCVSAKSTTGFTLSSVGAPAASQANTVYSFDYLVIG